MVPAVGQGIIAVQMRRGDKDIAKVVSRIDDEATSLESKCERAFAQRLGVDCYVPVGGCARAAAGSIKMVGMVANEDGTELRKKTIRGDPAEAAALGRMLAEELLARPRGHGGAAS
jgi:hydroxymethylbilane synthase